MYHKIKGNNLNFKVSDLIGVLCLIHSFYLYYHHIYIYFYISMIIGLFILSFNAFGLLGYYVKVDKYKIVLYEYFIPLHIKIKSITDIEKNDKEILLFLDMGKKISIPYNKIDKNQRYKMNDFYYDVHNIVQRNTLKV